MWASACLAVALTLIFPESMAAPLSERSGRDKLADGEDPISLPPPGTSSNDSSGLARPTLATPDLDELGADETLGPRERLLPDGSRTGSFVYVDAHGDLVRVKYVAGPAAGPRGFHLEERPVEGGRARAEPLHAGLQAEASGMAPLLLPPPKAVQRDPTPRPSDVFWQPRERADLIKAGLDQGPSRMRRRFQKETRSHG